MKWAYYVKEKMKAAAVLVVIMVIIFLNNISDSKTFLDLDHSITSIYEDRLMPATYIFQLTDHLYQKRLIYENAIADKKVAGFSETEHNDAIASLIKNYEATYLTKTEQKQWTAFKQHLQEYDKEQANTNIPNKMILNSSFNSALSCLNALSNIQANEGNQLRNSSKAMVSGTIITSRLEISLMLILGIFALILVGAGDSRIFKNANNPSLN